jgi:hypothetical protein
MMKREFLFSLLAILAMVVVLAVPALAKDAAAAGGSTVGQGVLDTFYAVVVGNIGLMLGMALALFGLYEWLVAQNTAVGLGMIVVGVCIAFVPNVFTGFQKLVGSMINTFGGTGAPTTTMPTGS